MRSRLVLAPIFAVMLALVAPLEAEAVECVGDRTYETASQGQFNECAADEAHPRFVLPSLKPGFKFLVRAEAVSRRGFRHHS